MATDIQRPTGGWTVEDYFNLDDDRRFEVMEGELIMVPAPGSSHQRAMTRLGTLIDAHVIEHDLGECFDTPFDVVLSETTVVQPDFTFVRRERFDDIHDGHGLTGAPDLVIEVLSPSSAQRDRTQKRDLYRQAGVEWLLLVDPDAHVVEVFRRDGESGKYVIEASAADDETLEFGLFEDLTIDLSTVWLRTREEEPPPEDES